MMSSSTKIDLHKVKLVELVDNGQSDNNFGEWRHKVETKFLALGLSSFLTDDPPVIPKHRREYKAKGFDSNGNESEITVPGNSAEVQKAKDDALPWTEKDHAALSLITDALPPLALHAVQHEKSTKAAWMALISHYQNPTSLAVDALFNKMSSYKWRDGMDEKLWADDMERMFARVVQMDPSRMDDGEFLRLVNVLMPQTGEWRSFANNVRKDMKDYESAGKRMRAKALLQRVRDEHFAVHFGDEESFEPLTSALTALERKRKTNPVNDNSPKKISRMCKNTFCERPKGHTEDICFAYGGGRVGQYPEWWKGPRDLHLHPSQRTRSAKASTEAKKPTRVNNAEAEIPPAETPSMIDQIDTLDQDELEVAHQLFNETPAIICVTDSVNPNEIYQIDPRAITKSTPLSNDIFWDTGANRHVFMNRTVFTNYTRTAPKAVLGFDTGIQTVSVGVGDVYLKANYNGTIQTIKLANCLHIPTSRHNLVSGTRMDSARIGCFHKDGKLVLFIDPKGPFAGGSRSGAGEMFKLNVEPINQQVPLADRLESNPLVAALDALNSESEKAGFCTAYSAT